MITIIYRGKHWVKYGIAESIVAYLKLIWHCMLIILQLKKKKILGADTKLCVENM